MSTKTVVNSKVYDIKAAAAYLGVSPHYMRKMILDKTIVARKVFVGDTTVEKWVVDEETLVARKATPRAHGSTTHQGRKCVAYVTAAQLEQIRALGIEIAPANVYDPAKAKARKIAKMSKKSAAK